MRKLMPLWIALAVAPAALIVALFVSMGRTELLFDPATCPYRVVETRLLEKSDALRVREDARECQPGVEERRWSVVRGAASTAIGLRRLPAGAFGAGYRWRARMVEGKVRLDIDNPGVPSRTFREQ